jgi:DNA-binding XRE family transcriptional regulator
MSRALSHNRVASTRVLTDNYRKLANIFEEDMLSHTMRIKELRERRGLTQMELAKLSGVSRATIARYEAGENRHPHPATVKRLAKVFKVRPLELM